MHKYLSKLTDFIGTRLSGKWWSQSRRAASTLLPSTQNEFSAEMRNIKVQLASGDVDEAGNRLAELSTSPWANAEVWGYIGIAHVLTGRHAAAIEPLQRALAYEPPFELAWRFLAAAQAETWCLSEALESGLRYLHTNPSDHETLTNVGVIFFRLGNTKEATRYLERALQVNTKALNALCNLLMFNETGLARMDAGPNLQPRTLQILKRAKKQLLAQFKSDTLDIKDVPNLIALLHGNHGDWADLCEVVARYPLDEHCNEEVSRRYLLVYVRQGNAAQALAAAELLQAYASAERNSKYTLATIRLAVGSGAWGANWLAMRESHQVMRSDEFSSDLPEWDGLPLGGRKLFVYQDQGYGDAFIGLRLIEALSERHVQYALWVQPSIAALVRTVPGCELAMSQRVRPDPREFGCHLTISIFGLVSALSLSQTHISRFTNVRADSQLVGSWRNRLAFLPGHKIGLALMGNPLRHDDWVRSISSKAIGALASLNSKASWINLSVDKRPDLDAVVRSLPMNNYPEELLEFTQTAALIASLDAVVAIDCVVAHLALALGKPTWVLVPTQLDWRWRMGATVSPWWPAAKVIQGKVAGDWGAEMELLTSQLETLLTPPKALTLVES